MKRYEVTSTEWERIKSLFLPERTGKRGHPGKSNRDMLNGNALDRQERRAVATTSVLLVYSRFAKWRDSGILEKAFHTLTSDADMENISIDSTCVKVHQSTDEGKKRQINLLIAPEKG